jgi:hypothetical protein
MGVPHGRPDSLISVGQEEVLVDEQLAVITLSES